MDSERGRGARPARRRTREDAVGDSTTLLVRGDVRNGLNESEGRKLYAVRERLRLGQRISIIGQTGLERLLGQRHG
ncbi:hypothetical protein LZP97_03780 [Rhodococcus sp. DMF-1]|uniref:hypothetical protein n=1 Tax=Rhodococcus TaxID=1827 RepID=UPI0006612EAB|nr:MULTISPECIES: hypothetical protein [Rhodococcus]UIR37684.1 hypothetical protein LZP97_03780 [Rhodococcus sp. DMF-1]